MVSRADEAEDQVQLWATQAGFVSNPVLRDRTGWDRILDLSTPRQSHPNLDLLGLPSFALTARIQVKSTHGRIRRIPIRMSNWQRAIEDPLPWFYLVLCYSPDTDEIRELAAVHLDKDLIERVMKHLYSMDATDRTALHLKKYALTWNDENVLHPAYPDALRRRLEDAVPKNLFEYAEHKRQWTAQAGVPVAPKNQIRFTILASTNEELYRKISRAAVGLGEPLEISGVEEVRERFGAMRLNQSFPNGTDAKLTIGGGDHSRGWTLSITDATGAHELDIDASMQFSGGVIPGLPKEYWLTRITTPFVEVLLEHAAKKISLTFAWPSATQKVPLADLSKGLTLATTLSKRAGTSLHLILSKGSARLPVNCAIPTLELHDGILQLADQVECLVDVLHRLRTERLPEIPVIAIQHQAPMAALMRAALGGRRVTLVLEWDLPAELEMPQGRVAVLADAFIVIDDFRHILLVAVRGTPTIREVDGKARATLTSDDITVEGSWRFPETEIARFPFEARVEEAESRLLKTGIVQVWTHRF